MRKIVRTQKGSGRKSRNLLVYIGGLIASFFVGLSVNVFSQPIRNWLFPIQTPINAYSLGELKYQNDDEIRKLFWMKENEKRAIDFYNEGLKAFYANDLSKATSKYSEAISLNPHLNQAHNNLGVVYFRSYQYGHAKAEFQWAIDIAPTRAVLYENLAIFFYNTANYNEAGKCLVKALNYEKRPEWKAWIKQRLPID